MTRSHLHLKAAGTEGRIHHVTPRSAGWTYVGFDVHRLKPGQTVSGGEAGRETCLVLISGRADITAGGTAFRNLGERMTPFEGPPWSVYVPNGAAWMLAAETDVELAVCQAPARGSDWPSRLITPDTVSRETRGAGTNTRYVSNILPDSSDIAESLLVVEVITPGGHWSSYPSHKHDRDDLPHESLLEETYYHRFNPPQGFGFQRVYTDDRDLDETMAIEDRDVVLVPEGYHPCAAAHGYDLYYLNVMAGPKRIWRFHNEPAHAWLVG